MFFPNIINLDSSDYLLCKKKLPDFQTDLEVLRDFEESEFKDRMMVYIEMYIKHLKLTIMYYEQGDQFKKVILLEYLLRYHKEMLIYMQNSKDVIPDDYRLKEIKHIRELISDDESAMMLVCVR